MTLPTPIVEDLVATTQDQQHWKLEAKPSTSVTIEPGPSLKNHNELELVDNAVPGVARESLAFVEELKAIIAEAILPRHYVDTFTLTGNDEMIPPYAVVAIFQNATANPIPVTLGRLNHFVPANSTHAYPTLKAIVVRGGVGLTVSFSSRYLDAQALTSGAQ
jgi:hypothetical protein